MNDTIYRQAAIDAVNEWFRLYVINRSMSNVTSIQDILRRLPSAQPTIYGYDIRQLELIASILQKEGIAPERVKEAITDIGRIVEIITDEFEEQLRKAIRHE